MSGKSPAAPAPAPAAAPAAAPAPTPAPVAVPAPSPFELTKEAADTRTPLEIQKANEGLYRTSVKCIGYAKIVTAVIYLTLFSYSFSTINPGSRVGVKFLQVFLLFGMLGTAGYAVVLLRGAFLEDIMMIHYSLQLCLGLALLDLLIGLFGSFIYCRGLMYTGNFILLLMYLLIMLQILWSICVDFPQLLLYKQLLRMESDAEDAEENKDE